jgi:polyphosphate kinase
VKIDLVVRSVCTLRPGVKGLSRNISVRSIVGRFLEHARVFYFQNGGDEKVYIGSADMMERNLDHRVEALAAVKTTEIREQLKLMLDLAVSDNVGAWTLDRRGRWARVSAPEGEIRLSLQEQLMRHSVGDA